MARDASSSGIVVELPGQEAGPFAKIGRRVLLALALITLVALVTYAGRDGYVDPEDDSISLLDAFYYSTVTITTTGYGDVRPVTDEARLVTTIIVTPARVLFLILLVGTTLEILAERSRQAYRRARWRRSLDQHTIICGYGTKGRTAIGTLLGKGATAGQIVVIDERSDAASAAKADGYAVVIGDASNRATLEQAEIDRASSVVVAVDRDDAAVLVTLTARELNERATIVAAVREEENVHLLHQSGADSVVTSSAAAGRLLGLSTETPQITELLEDLLTVGQGLDIVERAVEPEEAGSPAGSSGRDTMLLAVVRDGELIRFDDERIAQLRPGDRIVELQTAA
jgi:voltage-gated potassium channel Kch